MGRQAVEGRALAPATSRAWGQQRGKGAGSRLRQLERDRGPRRLSDPARALQHCPARQALAGAAGGLCVAWPGLHPNTASQAADAPWLPSSVWLNRVLRTWGQGITPLVGAGHGAGALVQALRARASPGRVAGQVGGTWGRGGRVRLGREAGDEYRLP